MSYSTGTKQNKYPYHLYLMCVLIVCNVQLTEVIILFPSNKLVALTRAGWCVVCVVDYPASSFRYVVFTRYCGDVTQV